MRHYAAALLLLAVATASGAQTQPATPTADKPGIVRGRITAADNGRPLRRVRVSLSPAESRPSRPITASTNSQGQFEVTDVAPGPYYVSASGAGFLGTQYGQRRPGDRGTVVTVAAGQTIDRLDFSLLRGGVIAGRVVDEIGEPYPGVRVEVLGTRYSQGQRVRTPIGAATTDDLGQFRIAPLAPGTYFVAATSSEIWRTEKGEVYGYAPTYYPGATADLAQPVTLKPSEQRTDISLTLQSSRTARVAGRVLRETGEAMSGGQVGLMYSIPGAVVVAGARFVRTDGDGAFEFKDVPPGTYSVGGGSASEIVRVAGQDIDTVVLTVRTNSSVSGAVVTEEGSVPPFPLSGVSVIADAPLGDVLPTVRVVSLANDGTFKMSLGGPFLFRMGGLPPGWAVGSVHLGDKDIADTPWNVPTGGKTLAGLKIVLTQKISRVSGIALDAANKATSDATVVIFPEDAELWLPFSRLIRSARVGADGSFSFSALPPGTYRAIARDYLEDGQWEDKAFLESVRDTAERFTLGEGESRTLTLRIPR
jgi:hypothetical protein